MERETQSGITDPHYAVPRAVESLGGTRIMERGPNSEPDTPCPPPLIRRDEPGHLPPACLERGRSRTYRMMTCWDGPRYPAFNSYGSRLRSFQKGSWPYVKLIPGSFAAAGLFYTGTDLCAHCLTALLLHKHSFIHATSLYRLLTGHADETRCFHCGAGFRGCLGDEDDPWREHRKWFPNCVYVRFVMDDEPRPAAFTTTDDDDDGTVLRHRCTIL